MSTRESEYEALLARAENGELEELASVYHQLGCLSVNVSRAIAFYERSIEINLDYRPTNYELLSASYNNLAALLTKRGDHAEASTHPRRILNPPLRPPGRILQHQTKYDKAMEHFHEALTIQNRVIAADDPKLVPTLHNLASVHTELDEFRTAIEYYERAAHILRQHFPQQRSQLVYNSNKLGIVHCRMRNYAAALSCQEQALELEEQIVSSAHPSLANRHFNMAVALEGLRHYREAAEQVTHAIEILRQAPGVHSRRLRRYQRYLTVLAKKF